MDKVYDLAYHHKRIKKTKPHPDGFLGALKEELDKIRKDSDASNRESGAS